MPRESRKIFSTSIFWTHVHHLKSTPKLFEEAEAFNDKYDGCELVA